MSDRETSLRRMYVAFNDREVDVALGEMVPGVDWPTAWEGGRAIGHEEVREYWTRQWVEINSKVEPTGFTERPDGTIAVDVHQSATSVSTGDVLTDGPVVHVYAFDDETG